MRCRDGCASSGMVPDCCWAFDRLRVLAAIGALPVDMLPQLLAIKMHKYVLPLPCNQCDEETHFQIESVSGQIHVEIEFEIVSGSCPVEVCKNSAVIVSQVAHLSPAASAVTLG